MRFIVLIKQLAFIIIVFFGISTLCAATGLKKGDIIGYTGAFDQVIENDYFQHVGIYTGPIKNTVIEFSTQMDGLKSTKPRVIETPLKEFVKNREKSLFRIVDDSIFPNVDTLDGDHVVSCAESYLIHDGQQFGQYDFINNNCQHFVSLCKLGFRYSWQSDQMQTILKNIFGGEGYFLKGVKGLSSLISFVIVK